jgi:glycosyltransferase involved in cell wall biosynthesis
MPAPKYSLLLPVRNEAGRIDVVVRSVFAQLEGHDDWEVCFGDDASDDGTRERLQELARSHPFRLILPPANLGRGGIRNLLAESAGAETLIFVDGDCQPQAGFFRAWEGLDPQAAWIGKVSYETLPKSGFSRFLASGSGAGKLPAGAAMPAAYLISGNVRLSRALFRKAGGFRTDLPGWGGEDADLGYRLERLGVPLRYRAEAEVRHPSVTGVEAYFTRLFRFGQANLPVLIRDNPGLAHQFKLAYAHGPRAWLFLNPMAFRICRFLLTAAKGWPWPFPIYRYVVFNCYARGFRQAAPLSGPR